MTWQELEDAIRALPKNVKGMEACIWLPLDFHRPEKRDEFVDVTCLSCFDETNGFSVDDIDKNNFPTMALEEGPFGY